MAVQLKVGQSLVSAVDATAVVVTRAPEGEVELTCGGVAMAPAGQAPTGAEALPAFAGKTQIGKRYVDEADTVELLCTKAGTSALALGGHILAIREAKPLPASD